MSADIRIGGTPRIIVRELPALASGNANRPSRKQHSLSVDLGSPANTRGGTVVAGRSPVEDVTEIGCEATGPFDYAAPAELYFPSAVGRHRPLAYRRFASAAEALTFALETLSGTILRGAVLEVAGERYGATQIQALGYSKPSRLTTTASI